MNKRKIGTEKEELAAEFLKNIGYQIYEKNFRCKIGEIDLIAFDGECLVFVEVKYRKRCQNGYPEEAVTLKKQRTISKVALWYMMERDWSCSMPSRFDVIAINGDEIRWHKNAFPFRK